MQSEVLVSVVIAGAAMFFASAGWADVPAPPVNQIIGMDDVAVGALEEADCRICHSSGVPDRHHLLYGQPIPPGSLVPYPDADGDDNPDTIYVCLSCHDVHSPVVRDCTACHTGDSPHHTTPGATARDCVACHGDVVDNFNDGHYIPTYAPSLVTPRLSDGDGLPLNSRGNGAGACDYCHDDDGLPTPVILANNDLHHNTGLANCGWCHDLAPPLEERIRRCEQCHGPDSLHLKYLPAPLWSAARTQGTATWEGMQVLVTATVGVAMASLSEGRSRLVPARLSRRSTALTLRPSMRDPTLRLL